MEAKFLACNDKMRKKYYCFSMLSKNKASGRSDSKAYITEGAIWKSIIKFMLPIMLGMFFQQLYNTVDAVVVGRYVGKEALAAVGGGTMFFINLLIGFCGGVANGAAIIISQFFGAKKFRELSLALHTFMLLSIIMGFLVTLVGIFFCEFALNLIKTPPEIFTNAVTYLKIYFLGMIPMFLYNTGASILRSTGDSKTPFAVLVIACFANIFLDCFFVIVLRLGVAGVAFATITSEVLSMILIFLPLTRTSDVYKVEFAKVRLDFSLLKKMIRLGLPSGLCTMMYPISNLTLMSFINTFPTESIAAWTAWGKLDALFWMSVSSMGMALNTFSGQNYGAGKYDRIKKGAWQGLLIMNAITLVLVIVFRLFGRFFYNLFVPGEEAVIAMGLKILFFLTPAFFFYVPNEVLAGIIGGVGKTYVSMLVTLFGICGIRLLWLFAFCRGTDNFLKVITCYPISWSVSAVIFFAYFKSKRWMPGDLLSA